MEGEHSAGAAADESSREALKSDDLTGALVALVVRPAASRKFHTYMYLCARAHCAAPILFYRRACVV